MRIATGIAGEGIEDGEGRRANLQCEPGDRLRFGVDQWDRTFEKVRQIAFLPRLRLKHYPERYFFHDSDFSSPSEDRQFPTWTRERAFELLRSRVKLDS